MISYSRTATVVPGVTVAAYVAGNVIGGLLNFASVARSPGGGGLIQSAVVCFANGVVPALDLVIFGGPTTTSTITDRTALAVTAVDFSLVQGVLHLTDGTSLGSTSVVQSQQQAMPFDLAGNQYGVYAALVARGGFSLATVSDVSITIQVLQN